MRELARWLEETGRSEEAELWWRRIAETGDLFAMEDLAEWLKRDGRPEEAEQLRQLGIEPGGRTADPW
jgi:hypothetical protein